MKRTRIRALKIKHDGSFIHIFEIRDDQIVIRLEGIRHIISKPKGRSWEDIEIKAGDIIKVKKAKSNIHFDKLIFIEKKKANLEEFKEKETKRVQIRTQREINAMLDEDCDELLDEIRNENEID